MVNVVQTFGLKSDCHHLDIEAYSNPYSYPKIRTVISESIPTAGRKSPIIYTLAEIITNTRVVGYDTHSSLFYLNQLRLTYVVRRSYCKRPAGRQRRRCENNMKMKIRGINFKLCLTHVTQNKVKRRLS